MSEVRRERGRAGLTREGDREGEREGRDKRKNEMNLKEETSDVNTHSV